MPCTGTGDAKMNRGSWLIAMLAVLSLPGCDQRRWSREEISEIARESTAYSDGNTALTMQHDADLKEMRVEIVSLQSQIDALRSSHESLRGTFNNNVDIENSNKARDATARGACGTELVNYPDGSSVWRNKKCEVSDLPKS